MGELVFLAVAALVGAYCLGAVRRGRAAAVTVAMVADGIYVSCLWLPAHLQAEGLIQSKLARAGFALPPDGAEIDALSLRWALELVVLVGAEFLVWRTRRALDTPLVRELVDVDRTWERVAYVLVAVGAIATVVMPAPALEDRAEGGQGVGTLLRTFLIVGLSCLVYFRGFGRRINWLVITAGIVLLVVGNVRSPLLVVACAYLASQLRLGRLRRPSRLAAVVILVVAFALVGSVMSNLRANITRDYGYTVGQVVEQSFVNPWVAPYESGLDTLDGYRFSHRVAAFEPARPLDLLNVVLTFVPRAAWPDKPLDVSVVLSTDYLHYRGSGQFLSPTGYFTLVLGSYPAALLGLAAFAMLIAALTRRLANTFWYAIVLCVTIRFLLGGSSFDLYYGLTLALPAGVALALVAVRDRLRSVPLPRRVTHLVRADGAARAALVRLG